jgi:hypothetical protein
MTTTTAKDGQRRNPDLLERLGQLAGEQEIVHEGKISKSDIRG